VKTNPHEENARAIIKEAVDRAENPVFYYSGGKDSSVILHLLLEMGLKLPVVFHREPFSVHKYQFGLRQIARHGLTAYDWPPTHISMHLGLNGLAFVNHQQIGRFSDGRIACMSKPKNILEPEGEDFLCARDDILARPTGFFNYPWDMIIHGHKESDEDYNFGANPISDNFTETEIGITLAFPLRGWTDKDVWDYIEAKGLEIQLDRYNPFTRTELEDKRNNSEYFHACTACVDIRQRGRVVYCPKIKASIWNTSERIDYRDNTKPAYCTPKAPSTVDSEAVTA